MAPSRRLSNGRSPLVNQQRQITSFFTPNKASNPNPSPSPSISPTPPKPNPSSVTPHSNKPFLVIGPSNSSPRNPSSVTPSSDSKAKTPESAKKLYGSDAVGKKVRVYWPLDKSWYDGCVKSFDENSGKHLVHYDDTEEEMLELEKEKIEWVEEEVRSFQRLKRRSFVVEEDESKEKEKKSGRLQRNLASEKDLFGEEKVEEGSGGDDDLEDEVWGKNVVKEVVDHESDDMESGDEDEEDESKEKEKKFGRLQRNLAEEVVDEEKKDVFGKEKVEEGSGGDNDSEVEDWGKSVAEEVVDHHESDEDEEDEVVGNSKRGGGKNLGSRKRRNVGGEKSGSRKNSKIGRGVEKIVVRNFRVGSGVKDVELAAIAERGQSANLISNSLTGDVAERIAMREANKLPFLGVCSTESSSRGSTSETRVGATVATSNPRKPNSNDMAWEWGECRDPTNRNIVWCKICGKKITAGISRLKEHLAWKKGNVTRCKDVPNDVKNKCIEALKKTKRKKLEKFRIAQILEGNTLTKRKKLEEFRIAQILEGNTLTKRKKLEKFRIAQILEGGTLLGGEIGDNDDLKDKQIIRGNESENCGIFIGGSKKGNVASNVRDPLDTMLGVELDELKQSDLDNNNPYKEKLKKDAWLAIADWAYNVGLPLNAVRTPKFQHMIHAIGQYGKGMPAPNYYNMRVTLMRDMLKETKLFINSLRKYWEIYGCSIMSDIWTDGKGRCLINFLVNCPRGTIFLKSIDASKHVKDSTLIVGMMNEVIEDVGEENIIQFVTDNDSNFKAAGVELERQHPTLFWTPCAAHCINLILEDLGNKLHKIHKALSEARSMVVYIYNHGQVLSMMRKLMNNRELHRSCVTRFATSYYTLQSIWDNRCHLQVLFGSDPWRKSSFSTKLEGKRIENLVAQNEFWDNVHFACKVLAPLVDVLRLVGAEDKPCMGYIYEAMDRAKDQIEKNIGANDKVVTVIWSIIDQRWNDQLHHPLHAAAYYLNPSIFYKQNLTQIEGNKDIQMGLLTSIDRLVPNKADNDQLKLDLRMYTDEMGRFGTPSAKRRRDKFPPAEWWWLYGFEVPALEKFATRVLSLTCSALPCERSWSTFDHLHSKKRNCLLQTKLNDLAFVQYNKKLEQRMNVRIANIKFEAHDPIVLREVDENDDWLIPTDKELEDFVREGDDLTWTQVRNARGPTDLMPNTRSRMRQSSTNTLYSLLNKNEDELGEDVDIEVP